MKSAPRATVLALLLLLTGCATATNLHLGDANQQYLTAADILDHIACEIKVAEADVPELRATPYLATVNLTIQVDDAYGVTPNLSFIQPLAPPNTSLTNVANMELSGTGQRIFVLNASIKTDQISGLNAAKPVGVKDCVLEAHDQKMLGGDLNIAEAIKTGIGSYRGKAYILGGTADSAGPLAKYAPSFATTIQFTLKKGVDGIGPTWVLKRFKGPGGSNGLLNGTMTSTDKLVITFSPITKSGSDHLGALVATPYDYAGALARNQNLLTTTILQNIAPGAP
jgi:hypothetical protein